MNINITAQLTREEALALAQFIKRSTFETYRQLAADETEARLMMDAIDSVRTALAEKGFDPR